MRTEERSRDEMFRKTILVTMILYMTLFASYALLAPASSASSPQTHVYVVMGGNIISSTQLGTFPPAIDTIPFATRPPDLSPTSSHLEITFSDPDAETGVVDLSVPAARYVGVEHAFYDTNSLLWYKINLTMAADGYGWLFTGTGTAPLLGDVDSYTYGDNSGVYWGPESPLHANEKAADPGELPSPGTDGVAGTDDDGFGDGTVDPAGSSILYLPSTLTTLYWDGTAWRDLFAAPWPQVFTTGTVYDIIIEEASELNGENYTAKGDPWEFLAGLDHPGQDVDWDQPNWNAYVTYACSWSVLDIATALGDLDVVFETVEKMVREDLVIADINCDEAVDIFDIVTCSKAFGTQDEGPGPDGLCDTGDDKPVADDGFDAKADIKPNGVIDIFDIVAISKDFGEAITP